MDDHVPPTRFGFMQILKGLCPKCHEGKITQGIFGMAPVCPKCGYDLHPENGYYLGAMMVGFFVTSGLTIIPVLILKFSGVEDSTLLIYPFLQFLIVGPFITHYAKVIWAHVGYRAGIKMGEDPRLSRGRSVDSQRRDE